MPFSSLSPSALPAGPVGPASGPTPATPELREFGDSAKTRSWIYGNVLDTLSNLDPVQNPKYTLRLKDVRYVDPERFSKAKQKEAILTNNTMARRVRGTWELLDTVTGQPVDQRTQIVARVPFFTDRGTFIQRGVEHTLNHQQRLLNGIYARQKENGELESHANLPPGKGIGHRYFMDPAKGVFYIHVGQANIPLYPLLKALGAKDDVIKEAWGNDLHTRNAAKDDAQAIPKLLSRMLSKAEQLDPGTHEEKLQKAFARMELNPAVTKRTLGQPHTSLNQDVILAATKKLIAIQHGQAETDDRDHLANQQILGPEDLFAERLKRDHSRIRRQLLAKLTATGNLQAMPSGALTRQMDQAIMGSGLGQALDEVNAAELLDKQGRVTRMGEGGIPSYDAIPDSARDVSGSHFGFIDAVRTPESFSAGVDLYFARNARKGKDGQLYAQFTDPRTGQKAWYSPEQLSDKRITFPGALSSGHKHVVALQGGRVVYPRRRDIDLVLPHFEEAFSPLGNLVPLKSMVKAQRMAMASRMLTQALPLQNPEAPLVQAGMPGLHGQRSFEEEYAKHMGALHASKPGRVLAVTPDAMQVRYDDGSTEELELYNKFPFNRKTFIHQTPTVAAGSRFEPGHLLARSNFTDNKGVMGLGLNARAAMTTWRGLNFEDAHLISESMAKRLTSESMYQHSLEVDDKTKLSKNAFTSLFPHKFDKETLTNLDQHGIVRPGTEVEYGQPLILGARAKADSQGRVHRKRQAGFDDVSVLWQHHDRGMVTDVAWGPGGPVVVVQSASPAKVGDKLSGRYGDKGVIAAILPDREMPHDKDGKPFEVLFNPAGIHTRTNPGQLAELALSKIAAKTGKPYKIEDFASIPDMEAFVAQELKQHGVADVEDIIDPLTERKIPNIATGQRFIMKLHHTAEGKEQARSGGAYSTEGEPAKGGDTGCLTGDTLIETECGLLALQQIVSKQMACKVKSWCATGNHEHWAMISDWFHYQAHFSNVLTITLENGVQLHLTAQHLMYLQDGSKRLAADLVVGDDLME